MPIVSYKKLLTRNPVAWHTYSRPESGRHTGGNLVFWCRYAQSVCLLFGRLCPFPCLAPLPRTPLIQNLDFSALSLDGVPDKRAVKNSSANNYPNPAITWKGPYGPFPYAFSFRMWHQLSSTLAKLFKWLGLFWSFWSWKDFRLNKTRSKKSQIWLNISTVS